MDFSHYKFRCSSLPSLMTGLKKTGLTEKQEATLQDLLQRLAKGDKPLTAKQFETIQELQTKKESIPELGKTTKAELLKIYITEKYEKTNYLTSKAMYKGRIMEDQSIELYRKATQIYITKNKERKFNEYLSGEIDALTFKKHIVDIKTSWDIVTFATVTESQAKIDYEWQMVGYMDLHEIPTSEIAYCLVSLPDYMISDEVQKIAYAERLIGELDAESHQRIMDIEEQLTKYYTYENIPLQKRVKRYQLHMSNDLRNTMYNQLDRCRQYLNQLTL